MHTLKIMMISTRKCTIILYIITTIQIYSTSSDNIQIQAINNDLKENILSKNNTKIHDLAPHYNNELVAYNQLLPYLYSKLPIPVSLINQLRKYNINKNMLNKIHSYNQLRRELHSKLIENEINGFKYNDILSKKLQNLFKSVNKEEKKNFLNLMNYLKMFNFDNNKLYNTLNDGNDILKLISGNKMKYLPFINTDKTLPDLFNNNKVNKEIKRILIQYKISSKDLYNKLINKVNPLLLEDMKKNNLVHNTGNKENIDTIDINENNPDKLLKERIQDLASFRKNPRLIPLNEKIHYKKRLHENIDNTKNEKRKEVDQTLNKYIKDLRLMNVIEKERDDLVNIKIDSIVNANKNNAKEKNALRKPNPAAELLALYMVLSIPGLLSALPSKHKRLAHIKRTKEDILQHSHIEAGRLYHALMNKNLKESLNNIHDMIKKDKYAYKLGGLDIDNFGKEERRGKKTENSIKMGYHPFGHELSHNLVSENNYYDAPKLAEYGSEPINNNKEKQINGLKLYSALKSKNRPNSMKDGINNKGEKSGNHIYNFLSNAALNVARKPQVEEKVDGKHSFQLHSAKNNDPDKKVFQNAKIDGQTLFDMLVVHPNSGGWKEDTVYSKKSNARNSDKAIDEEKNFKIEGQNLFNLLDTEGTKYKVLQFEGDEPKVDMKKFYEKLYKEFIKDNRGTLSKMDTNMNKNKVLWNDQNVEIPNISAADMTRNKKQSNIKGDNENNSLKRENSKEDPKG